MNTLLEAYKNKRPEIIFEWNDSLTSARGWVVINSLRGGAAGGGTRMRAGLTREEVVSLAKVMEIKFSVSGPDIGGAKSGIDFDPSDPRRDDVLKRWYTAVIPLLSKYYGTGGDLNVDELKDVIPITEDLGLWHPQEGVVNGHFKPDAGEKVRIIGQLREGCTKIITNPKFTTNPANFAIADMITGYGVAVSVIHSSTLFHNEPISGKTAIIQGWGNVASAAALYLAREGVKIVGILDRNEGIIAPEGLPVKEVENLFAQKKGNILSSPMALPFDQVNEQIWDLGAQIFVPAAASKLVTKDQINRLMKNGLQIVSCGANVPFTDDGVFFGPTALHTDEAVTLIPDFIANCGMARAFAYFMQPDAVLSDDAIFNDVSTTIEHALKEVANKIPDSHTGVSATALNIALNKLVK
jgi:glutamate dehydrogenase/leucine dehydrogenase